MINKLLEIFPEQDQNIGLSFVLNFDGNILFSRCHCAISGTDYALVYKITGNTSEVIRRIDFPNWRDTRAVGISVVGDRFYFVVTDNKQNTGKICVYDSITDKVDVVIEVPGVTDWFGFNDTSLAVSRDEQWIAVTDMRTSDNNGYIQYDSSVLIFNQQKLKHTIQKPYSNPRVVFGRSLKIISDTLVIGSPDLSFDPGASDFRNYNGTESTIDFVDLETNRVSYRFQLPGQKGTFAGTELSSSNFSNTVVGMVPGFNNQCGAGFVFTKLASGWVIKDCVEPLRVPVRTGLKLSLYASAVSPDGNTVVLGNSLRRRVFVFRHGELVYTHRENCDPHTKYAFDMAMSGDFKTLVVNEMGWPSPANSQSKLHVYSVER